MAPAVAPASKSKDGLMNQKNSKPAEIRKSNMRAAKALSDAIRTSLGPKGMDKMIQSAKGDVTITNDGATILAKMSVIHPAAKMLVELSQAQDIEAGDGTTSVVVLAGSLLDAAEQLLNKGIHPTVVSDAFQVACQKAIEYLKGVSIPIDLEDKESLMTAASTSLNSKVVSNYGTLLAQIAVDAVLKVKEENTADLNNIRVLKMHGGTVEDTEMVDGLVLQGGSLTPTIKSVKDAKIGLIQFCLSPPKTDMDNQVIVKDYAAMDRVLKEERAYILDLCKNIKKAGCTVVLIQKSILRDAISDMAVHFLGKLKIMAVKDIERDQIEHIARTLKCVPVASIDNFEASKLGSAKLVEEESIGGSKVVKFKGIANGGPAVSVIVRGSNNLVLDEAERSLHDALCVIRCLVKKPSLIVGGGAPETELAVQLMDYAKTLKGADSYCVKAYAQALEVIPYTLAENAGLDPIKTVTELRQRHKEGDKMAGINVRKGTISSMKDEKVLQPFLVSSSEVTLASETVRSILKIDDVINTITDTYLG